MACAVFSFQCLRGVDGVKGQEGGVLGGGGAEEEGGILGSTVQRPNGLEIVLCARPDIIVMADWALDTNYLSILLYAFS